MKLMIFYAIGYVIAAVWTAVWVLREEVEESKAFRIVLHCLQHILFTVLNRSLQSVHVHEILITYNL